jgi:hypothetical protein
MPGALSVRDIEMFGLAAPATDGIYRKLTAPLVDVAPEVTCR